MTPKSLLLWFLPLVFVNTVGHAARPVPPDYVLDDTGEGFALYKGQGVRSVAKAKDVVRSYKELKSRVLALPRGTRLYWLVSTDDSEGHPMLFEEGQFADFQQVCNRRDIQLNISHVGPAPRPPPPPPPPPQTTPPPLVPNVPKTPTPPGTTPPGTTPPGITPLGTTPPGEAPKVIGSTTTR